MSTRNQNVLVIIRRPLKQDAQETVNVVFRAPSNLPALDSPILESVCLERFSAHKTNTYQTRNAATIVINVYTARSANLKRVAPTRTGFALRKATAVALKW